MNNRSTDHDRLLELLADRALFGLDSTEQAELDRLASAHPDVSLDEMDQVAALVELSAVPTDEPLPANVLRQIQAAMPVAAVQQATKVSTRPIEHTSISWWSSVPNWTGWATAAALLVALLSSLYEKPTNPTSTVDNVAASRSTLLESATDLVQVEWTATGDESGPEASGDVVWSNDAQRGFMRFTGLAANSPSANQYQLWIFDAEQDEKYPIDGGVFDIPAGADEVIIPIEAKIAVTNPTMFAITVEKPGGVVVSSRDRLPLLAKVSG